MCQIKSAIVLKNSIYMPLDENSHEVMIKDLKLKDVDGQIDFVRVEMIPIDGNYFNHNLKNWKLKVDQNQTPEWFDPKSTEIEMRKEIKIWFKKRFILNGMEIEEIKDGLWYIIGGTIGNVSGGTIKNVRGGIIKNVWEGIIEDVRGGTIKNVKGGIIKNVSGGVIIYPNDKKIVVADPNYKLELFKK